MRRLSLSTKLFAAAAPLVLAVAMLLALTVRSDYQAVQQAENGAQLGNVWEPLIASLNAVEAESAQLTADAPEPALSSPMTAVDGTTPIEAVVDDATIRQTTDQAINELRDSIEGLNSFDAASLHITTGRSSLSAARRNLDMKDIAPQMVADVDPGEAYGVAIRELVAVGQLLPPEAGDPELGSELLAVVKLAEAKLHANDVIAGTSQWPNEVRSSTPLVQARAAFASMISTLGEFEAVAPDEWASQYRQSGFTAALGSFSTSLDSVTRAAQAGRIETFDTAAFAELTERGVGFQRAISASIVERANTDADAARKAALIRVGIILGAVLLASLIAWFIIRSITRRVTAIANSANRVATEQLPALVEALRDPRGKAVLPAVNLVDAKGSDDLAELARAFNSMQETLIDVAHEQVEVLRRGVSEIFVTMARRNRSLIDRQLAMLDEYEASVDDPEVLGNYYQLDHLATRMRRNSESLLVLANAEPKRRRVKATEIDDVVRASIGEVEDYRRVEIQHLESLQVRGNVVADISHLLAELLDNATSFSPPGSPVRVGGRNAGDSYMLRIVDDGVGIAPERLRDLNVLLREPPVVGLSVESTLGVSVVSLLANKHGIEVTLSAGSPGLTVDVVLPSSLFGPMDAPAAVAPAPVVLPQESAEQIVAWNDQPDGAHDESFEMGAAADTAAAPIAAPAIEPTPEPNPQPVAQPVAEVAIDATPAPTPEPAPQPMVEAVPNFEFESYDPQPVEAAPVDLDEADWTKMSLDLSAFTTGADTGQPAVGAPPIAEPVTPVAAAPPDAPVPTGNEAPVASLPADPTMPPPLPARSQGEFDTPLSPPVTANGLAQRPVTPDTARPLPTTTVAPPTDSSPALPTRTNRGSGPEGPDRLADPLLAGGADESPVATSEPSALQAALSAFDSGRSAVGAELIGDLPTRAPVLNPAPHVEEKSAVAQSRVDPSALRDRLRAFQTEFSNAGESGSDIYNTSTNDQEGTPR